MGEKPKASVLTNSHREYFLNDHEPANESDFKGRIRDRLYLSVFDFYIILNHMDLEDIREAFREREPDLEDENVNDVEDLEPNVLNKFGTALPALFGVPYLRLYPEEKQAENQELGWRMESYIESGIRRALNRMGESVRRVDVNIDIELGEPLEDLADMDLTELDHDTLQQLQKAELISNDEFAEAWVEIKNQNGG